ncbi:hypothetical protein GQ43DRAFT_445974 [Delitschia confertaspora ATCC 74209]|uniref:Splicing factor Cactin n=1 Tax=Delitschia confertaspora ATCC 74209 TaxID=1513339 RepID=A0A9P4JUF4_9PLEO|nr:hypothetical protein GQ43DRAFT_445974 [Delitschia confertaspora ATCC 74209]
MDRRNPPPWRAGGNRPPPRQIPHSTIPAKRSPESSSGRPAKRSVDAQEEAWVADEDRFVLQQAKKKAAIRVKGGRAKPIDWLAVTLRFIDPTKTLLDEEIEDHELDIMDPEGVFEGLYEKELAELQKDIDNYLALETNKHNRDFWKTMKIICKDRREKSKPSASKTSSISSVATDIDRLLAPKTYEQLETLEDQVKKKLDSDESIDVDYWENLLSNLLVWKAKAKMRRVSQAIINERLQTLRKQSEEEAAAVREKLQSTIKGSDPSMQGLSEGVPYNPLLDPEPMLKLRTEDKVLDSYEEVRFLKQISDERRKVLKLGYVPMQQKSSNSAPTQAVSKSADSSSMGLSRFAPEENIDYSKTAEEMYQREVARGVNEDEEIFAGEEQIDNTVQPQWATRHKPRKPRYFNRVQLGYEWNKYNQTHYDHDNPPPKVVQGYKFNIFYPDLIDKSKAPTYRIERENGRKKGESLAPAGEDDTCLIRFIAGPPYEDLAFRIVDKEWDYASKRERGFRSSFDKGVLQLHFQFKKVYYRK